MNLGWTSREKKLAFLFALFVFLVGSILAYALTTPDQTETTPSFSSYPEELKELEQKEKAEAEVENQIVWIDLKGAVEKPGVYQLPANSRVIDVIKLAGGLTATAEKRSVNLVDRLQDGQMIYIPHIGEAEELRTSSINTLNDQAKGDLISINKASEEQLQQLPGIGPSRAAAIMAYREEHGRFKKKEDLMEIPGIGEKIFEQLKDQILIE